MCACLDEDALTCTTCRVLHSHRYLSHTCKKEDMPNNNRAEVNTAQVRHDPMECPISYIMCRVVVGMNTPQIPRAFTEILLHLDPVKWTGSLLQQVALESLLLLGLASSCARVGRCWGRHAAVASAYHTTVLI